MFKTTTNLITAVLLLLTISLFAQDTTTDDKAIVKDAQGISTGMTKSEFEQFKADYMAKGEELLKKKWKMDSSSKIDGKRVRDKITPSFNNYLNLNRIEEYNKLGVDLYVSGAAFSVGTKFIQEQVAVLGTVKAITYLDSAEDITGDKIRSLCKFEIEEIYKGKDKVTANLEPDGKSIIIAAPSSKKFSNSGCLVFKVGSQYLLFSDFYYMKELNKTVLDASSNYYIYPIASWKPDLTKVKANFKAISKLQEEDRKGFYKLNFKDAK